MAEPRGSAPPPPLRKKLDLERSCTPACWDVTGLFDDPDRQRSKGLDSDLHRVAGADGHVRQGAADGPGRDPRSRRAQPPGRRSVPRPCQARRRPRPARSARTPRALKVSPGSRRVAEVRYPKTGSPPMTSSTSAMFKPTFRPSRVAPESSAARHARSCPSRARRPRARGSVAPPSSPTAAPSASVPRMPPTNPLSAAGSLGVGAVLGTNGRPPGHPGGAAAHSAGGPRGRRGKGRTPHARPSVPRDAGARTLPA
jgi:hypothetical protein